MNGHHPITRAVTDARALLDSLQTSKWQDMHVISGNTEIFIARHGGRCNPMQASTSLEVVPAASTADATETEVKAQHVATLVNVVPVGTSVKAGEKVATLRVLDEEEVVVAPTTGNVIATPANEGTLIEFDVTILTIAGVA